MLARITYMIYGSKNRSEEAMAYSYNLLSMKKLEGWKIRGS